MSRFDSLQDHEFRRDEWAAQEREQRPQQLTPDTKGEWRVVPMDIHGWAIFDKDNAEIVSNIYREEDAAQIVAGHRAARSQALLVEALQAARGFICEQTWNRVQVNRRLAELRVDQIDAALKAAGGGE